jgi:hypothetical protein
MKRPFLLEWLCLFRIILRWSTVQQCQAFTHQSCTRATAAQFSFPNCYVPSMNPELLLSQASFLMSHDAATGYLPNNRGVSSATNLYAKNQIGSVYDQLNDGARALDVRPKLLQNGTVVCHHGAITIPVSLKTLVQDAVRWASEHPDELVLILHFNMVYEESSSSSSSSSVAASTDTTVSALSQVYQSLGVTYLSCGDVYGLTVAETMELAQLSSGGSGYVLALDRQNNAYASTCAKLNYLSDQIVTCYPSSSSSNNNNTNNNNILPCTKPNSPAFQDLKSYVLASANNDATDSDYELGPPASLDYYPFNAIQALWQVDTHAAAMGVAHVSSLIDDNTKSKLNARLVDWVYNGEFNTNAISLLMVDHVQLNGNALLSVLRNTCGQSELVLEEEEDDDVVCGNALAKPKLRQKHMSTLSFYVTCSIYLLFGLWLAYLIRHYRKYYNHDQQIVRLKQDLLTVVDEHFPRVMAGESLLT